jgi:hypothetical protein
MSGVLRLAGYSAFGAVGALVISGIALALFFGGAGDFWGPINDVFITLNALLLIPPALVLSLVVRDQAGDWFRIASVVGVAGLLVIGVGQLLLVIGVITLQGSFVSGGIGLVPLLGWMVALAVVSLGSHALSASIGWSVVTTLAFALGTTAAYMLAPGTLTWILSGGMALAIAWWMASLGVELLGRAAA